MDLYLNRVCSGIPRAEGRDRLLRANRGTRICACRIEVCWSEVHRFDVCRDDGLVEI